MRTTLAIPDELFHQAEPLMGEQRFSQFVREAVRHYVAKLQKEKLAREMEEGYRAEARASSLDPEWSDIEVEGWP